MRILSLIFPLHSQNAQEDPSDQKINKKFIKIERYLLDKAVFATDALGLGAFKNFGIFKEKNRSLFTGKILVHLSQMSTLAIAFFIQSSSHLYHFLKTGSFATSALLGFIAPPIAITLLCLSIFQAIIELYHCRQTLKTLAHFSSESTNKGSLLKSLEYINENYFTLSKAEKKLILQAVEEIYEQQLSKSPDLLSDLKSAFPSISDYKKELIKKAELHLISLKMKTLSRRVSMKHAKKMQEELPLVLTQLKSFNPFQIAKGKIATKAFFHKAEAHAKTQVLVHTIALVTVALAITSLVMTAAAFSFGLIPLILGGISAAGFLGGLSMNNDWLYGKISLLFQKSEREISLLPKTS